MVLKSINPATGKIIKEYNEWNVEKIDAQLLKSLHAFEEWKKNSYSDRSKLLKKTAAILRNNKQIYASLITTEMGKPIIQSEAEIEKCAWVCEYYAENGEKFLENEYVNIDTKKSYVRFSPLGIILTIMPWNFPFWQVFRCAAPALMIGNTILLKHSSNVPQCSLAIENIFEMAGFPKDVFRSLLIGSKLVERVIEDNKIAAASLTGSSSAGRSVAKKSGAFLKKTVLELGGSDPFIILEDADVSYTVEQAVKARMINTGQSCIAAKRFIVVKDIFDEFKDSFSDKVNQLVVGDPMDRSTDIGPLARKDLTEQLDFQVKKSIQKGATVIIGGKRLEGNPGFYYLPTVLSDVKKGMPVYDEETFGPVASLIKVRNEREAIRVANDTYYGLGASIWTQDIERGESLVNDVQSGAVFVNEIVKSDPRLPFGGIKDSGYGRELSHYGIKEFANIQTVFIKKL
ncbi:MAG: NAD-dependent succinate-semialdehyde dehydrogenase [Petrotogales bacterium]